MHFSERLVGRKSLRLRSYDYRRSGFYYVTLCTQNRACLFGEIRHGEMVLSEAGRMMRDLWLEIPKKYFGFEVDVFIVMPNHVHGVFINNTDAVISVGPAQGPAPTLSVPEMIRNYKSYTMSNYIRGVKEGRFEPFDKKLWQRNYYEHIIRSEACLMKIRQYIEDNPTKWDQDQENPLWAPERGPARGPAPTKSPDQ